MKKYNLLFLLVFIIPGCKSTPDNISDAFVSYKPHIAPGPMSGIWTSKIGTDLWTLKINNNGTGVSCYSYQGRDGVQNIKYAGLRFIVDNGVLLNVKTYNNAQLIVTSSNNDEEVDYLFVKDDGKKFMSSFCFKYFAIW